MIATASLSLPAHSVAVGRIARSLKPMPSARASAPISRTSRTSSSAESGIRQVLPGQRARGDRERHESHPAAELRPLEGHDLRAGARRARRRSSSARARRCARALSPPASSPTRMLTLRVKSTRAVAAAARRWYRRARRVRARRRRPAASISFLSGPFWIDSVTSKCCVPQRRERRGGAGSLGRDDQRVGTVAAAPGRAPCAPQW